MKKIFIFSTYLMIIFTFISCKKGYTFLNANNMFSIPLKDPNSAIGRVVRSGQNKSFLLTANTMKASIDYSEGFVYIVDSYMNRVLKFNLSGKLILVIYNEKIQNTTFYELPEQAPTAPLPNSVIKAKYDINSPGVIASDSEGNIYVETYTPGTETKPAFHYILKFLLYLKMILLK